MHADVLRAINVQINSEFSAWYQYLAMAAFCEREQFTGAARLAAGAERRGVSARHEALQLRARAQRRRRAAARSSSRPASSIRSARCSSARSSRKMRVTEQINSLYELCFKSKAFAEMTELQWFLTEQVEEEKTAREWVAKFRLVGDDPGLAARSRSRARQPDTATR